MRTPVNKIFFCILFIVFMLQSVQAFDWNKCKPRFGKEHSFFGLFAVSSTSSSEWSSSLGDCSMLGMNKLNLRKYYISMNFEKIKADSARREGAYIDAYAILASCNNNARAEMPILLQKNYINIFGESADKLPEEIFGSIEQLILIEPALRSGCNPTADI